MNKIAVIALLAFPFSVEAQSAPVTNPCAAAEFHQFDFFIGDWNTYDVGSTTIKAHNTVTPMVGGCAVREVYSGVTGFTGESFSTYDTARHVWHQSWVTTRGELLLLDGGPKGRDMVFTGPEQNADGKKSIIRGTWHPNSDGTIRETAVHSFDGGKTWTPVFDIIFKKR